MIRELRSFWQGENGEVTDRFVIRLALLLAVAGAIVPVVRHRPRWWRATLLILLVAVAIAVFCDTLEAIFNRVIVWLQEFLGRKAG